MLHEFSPTSPKLQHCLRECPRILSTAVLVTKLQLCTFYHLNWIETLAEHLWTKREVNLTWSNGVLETSAFSVSFHIENDQPPTVSKTSEKKGDLATVVIGPAWASVCQFGRGATNLPESPSFTNLEEVYRTSPCSVPQKKSFFLISQNQCLWPEMLTSIIYIGY